MQARLTDYAKVKKTPVVPQTISRPFGARTVSHKKTSSPSRHPKFRFEWPSVAVTWLQKLFLAQLVTLCGIGLFFVFEASTAESFQMVGNAYHFLNQQSKWMLVGVGSFLLGWSVPAVIWKRTAVIWYGVALAALVAVFIPGLGLELNGAHRWLSLGGFVAQPAEFLKFAILIFFASWLSRHQRLGAFLLFLGIPALLVLLQPDLGSLLIVVWLAFSLFFFAEGNLVKFLPIGAVGLVALIIAIVSSPYRLARVTTYLNPEADPLGKGFHVRQVTLGLGNGGWFGQGVGNSTQKYLYIPEASSDSIFAIIAEELGFVGSVLILGLFASFVSVIFALGRHLPEQSFERLLVQGIGAWVAGQVLLNISAVVALVPLTGIPLPFFSYGGSSLLMLFFIMGLLFQLSQKKA